MNNYYKLRVVWNHSWLLTKLETEKAKKCYSREVRRVACGHVSFYIFAHFFIIIDVLFNTNFNRCWNVLHAYSFKYSWYIRLIGLNDL